MDPRVKQFVKRFTLVKRLVGWSRARETRSFARRWGRLLDTTGSAPAGARGPSRVLLATSTGAWQPGTRLDSVLAAALRLRGAEVEAFLCDEALPACQLADAYFYPSQRRFLRDGPKPDLCPGCFGPAAELFDRLDVRLHRLSERLADEEVLRARELAETLSAEEIQEYRIDDIPVGEHALAGALRFFANGELEVEPHGEAVLRAYFRAALRTLFSVRRLVAGGRYDCAVIHHGIYVPQGIVSEVCKKAGVRVVTWHPAYRRNCFTFAVGDTYHRAMISEPTDRWESIPWSDDREERLMAYLESRRSGTRDWISFNREPNEDIREIASTLGLDLDKPLIGLLTTVMWDARLHYPTNAFDSVQEWVLETIDCFGERPDLQLVIRVHPAEVRGRLPARQRMVDVIEERFPQLPDNVFVVPPDSPIGTYALMERCDSVLIYATKTGIELTARGIPVVVAGEAWIRNKGFSLDAESPEHYREILDRLPLGKRLSDEEVRRARRYAYHYFFRRMIPLPFVHQGSNRTLSFDVELDDLDELRPGREAGLDVICDGILSVEPFVYPAEEIEAATIGQGEPEPHQALV